MIPRGNIRPVNHVKLGDYLAANYTITLDKYDRPIYTLKK
jgi:hypothetical protein